MKLLIFLCVIFSLYQISFQENPALSINLNPPEEIPAETISI